MTDPQKRVLKALDSGAVTVNGIAHRIRRDRRTAAHVLDALFRRSLVTVEEGDRWTLTPRGQAKVISLRSET